MSLIASKFIKRFSKTKPIDLDKFLTDFLKEQYGEKTAYEFKRSIESVDKLRNRQFLSSENYVSTDANIIIEYYLVLKSLEPIIADGNNQIFVNNEWSHSQRRKPYNHERWFDNRFSFEILNVLFVLAMNFLKKIDGLKPLKPENLENYINLGEMLLGCFVEMKKYSENDGLESISCFLSPIYINIIINIFLIEIQFNIIHFGPQDDNEKLKRMCAYTQWCASETLDILLKQNKILINEEMEKCLRSYEIISRSKMNLFQSLIENSESRFGNSLAYRKLSVEDSNLFLKLRKNDYSHLIHKNNESLRKAHEKDRIINNSVIPKTVDYPKVEMLQVVKPSMLTIDNLFDGKKCELAEEFKKLVPLVVKTATKTFSDRISQITSMLSYSSFMNEIILNDTLAELNIPAYFEKCEKNGLPLSITKKVNYIYLANGIESIEQNFNLLDDFHNENKIFVLSAIQCIKNKEKGDMRHPYKNNFTSDFPSSLEANQLFISILKNVDDSLEISEQNNILLKKKFLVIKPSLLILIGNKMELCSLNKEKNLQISSLKPENLDKIYDLYNKTCVNKNEELKMLKIFEKRNKEIEIIFSNKFKNDGFLNVEDDCQKLFDEFQPTINQIRKLIANTASITFELNKFTEKFDQLEVDLSSVLKDFNSYLLIQRSVSEAFLFYQKTKNNLSNIQNKIDEFRFSGSCEANNTIKIIDSLKYFFSKSSYFKDQKQLNPELTGDCLKDIYQDYFEKYFQTSKTNI